MGLADCVWNQERFSSRAKSTNNPGFLFLHNLALWSLAWLRYLPYQKYQASISDLSAKQPLLQKQRGLLQKSTLPPPSLASWISGKPECFSLFSCLQSASGLRSVLWVSLCCIQGPCLAVFCIVNLIILNCLQQDYEELCTFKNTNTVHLRKKQSHYSPALKFNKSHFLLFVSFYKCAEFSKDECPYTRI